jgi:hypothetical protein
MSTLHWSHNFFLYPDNSLSLDKFRGQPLDILSLKKNWPPTTYPYLINYSLDRSFFQPILCTAKHDRANFFQAIRRANESPPCSYRDKSFHLPPALLLTSLTELIFNILNTTHYNIFKCNTLDSTCT